MSKLDVARKALETIGALLPEIPKPATPLGLIGPAVGGAVTAYEPQPGQ